MQTLLRSLTRRNVNANDHLHPGLFLIQHSSTFKNGQLLQTMRLWRGAGRGCNTQSVIFQIGVSLPAVCRPWLGARSESGRASEDSLATLHGDTQAGWCEVARILRRAMWNSLKLFQSHVFSHLPGSFTYLQSCTFANKFSGISFNHFLQNDLKMDLVFMHLTFLPS